MAVTQFRKASLYKHLDGSVRSGWTARYHGTRREFDEFIPRIGEWYRLQDGRAPELQQRVRGGELRGYVGKGRTTHTAHLIVDDGSTPKCDSCGHNRATDSRFCAPCGGRRPAASLTRGQLTTPKPAQIARRGHDARRDRLAQEKRELDGNLRQRSV